MTRNSLVFERIVVGDDDDVDVVDVVVVPV